MATAAVLATVSLLPAAQAKPPGQGNQPVFVVGDGFGYEYEKTCTDTEPYSCGTHSGRVLVYVTVQNRPNPLTAITVGWQIVPITATPGVDFTGPTSGTLTIPTYSSQQPVIVPVVIDGLAEPHRDLTVSLTCTARPAGQQWRLAQASMEAGWGVFVGYGNTVTGNGTSTATTPVHADGTGSRFEIVS